LAFAKGEDLPIHSLQCDLVDNGQEKKTEAY